MRTSIKLFKEWAKANPLEYKSAIKLNVMDEVKVHFVINRRKNAIKNLYRLIRQKKKK